MQWYGSPSAPELQLPMDTLVGFHQEGGGITNAQNVRLNLDHFRNTIEEMETELDHDQPLLVFDNHDNERSWDRFGDGAHNEQIAKLIASILFTTHSTSLMYYGEEIGMVTSTPTRREDVKDPIGITGWPKVKGRDGERTPMQWDTSNRQAGFSTDPHTWLPVPANYTTVNVATESKEPQSLLDWHEELIRMRRDTPALHDGGFLLLDPNNPSVLSYLRTAPKGSPSTIIALNFTDKPQIVSFNLGAQGIGSPSAKTILTDDETLKGEQNVSKITLAPYASWIAEVQ
jgi:alpha-glucosidase